MVRRDCRGKAGRGGGAEDGAGADPSVPGGGRRALTAVVHARRSRSQVILTSPRP